MYEATKLLCKASILVVLWLFFSGSNDVNCDLFSTKETYPPCYSRELMRGNFHG